jgi:A/G-specific adenine glycosylase
MSTVTAALAAQVVDWQRTHGRHDLPWQHQRDPYRVWLSEIMLQQTQVSTVLGYYERFLARFPDVAALAAADVDEVLALWAGLGYYSRARNLHRCAQDVMTQWGGAFPRTAVQLAQLPGIGPSTAAAIAAFCFEERAAILDGNVKRVLSRALGFGDDLAQVRHERRLWALAQTLVPAAADMPAYTQGLMDLGATLCTPRQPRCLLCPLASDCVARAQGQPEAYPVKTRQLRRSQRAHALLWLCHGDAVWLERRPDTGIWVVCLAARLAGHADRGAHADPCADACGLGADAGSRSFAGRALHLAGHPGRTTGTAFTARALGASGRVGADGDASAAAPVARCELKGAQRVGAHQRAAHAGTAWASHSAEVVARRAGSPRV